MDIMIPLIIGLVVGLIVLFSLLSQLKSVAQKHTASDYITQHSLHLTVRDDRFITKHTERQMIRQAPDPGAMPPGAPTSSHQGAGPKPPQGGFSVTNMPKPPQSSHSGMNAPRPQQGGGLNIVDTPKHGK